MFGHSGLKTTDQEKSTRFYASVRFIEIHSISYLQLLKSLSKKKRISWNILSSNLSTRISLPTFHRFFSFFLNGRTFANFSNLNILGIFSWCFVYSNLFLRRISFQLYAKKGRPFYLKKIEFTWSPQRSYSLWSLTILCFQDLCNMFSH